jgi:hypothetical protein
MENIVNIFLAFGTYTYHLSIIKHKIADMSKKQSLRDTATESVEVRNVEFDAETDGNIDVWRARKKREGKRFKRGEAVVELTKKGLKAEGIA